jgi:flavin-dependent dehydrogenase
VSEPPVDALIIGAGPAGAVAASLLAAWGHEVVLIDRGEAGDDRRRAESIPPSARRVLNLVGAIDGLESGPFLPWRGTVVWWAGGERRVEAFPEGAGGYQVLRAEFDRRLAGLAQASGASVVRALAREASRVGADAGGGLAEWHVAVEATGGARRLAARRLIDCSGRSGLVGRRAVRETTAAHRTVALAAEWRFHRRWDVVDDAYAAVASYEAGWAWSIAVGAGLRHVTVMVDPERTGLLRGAPARAVYETELSRVPALAGALGAASMTAGPWGFDASAYRARDYAPGGCLLAGDAASAIDPLSSFGVKKALVSGWLAAVATHTGLVRPALRDTATAFFVQHERAMHAAAERGAAAFAADAARAMPHPFWLARAQAVDDLPSAGGPDPAVLRQDPAVLAAFDRIRRAGRVRFVRGRAARLAPHAAVEGREITLRDHLSLPSWPEPVRFLRGVDLVALLEAAESADDVGVVVGRFADAHPHVILPDLVGALAVLVATGALDLVTAPDAV